MTEQEFNDFVATTAASLDAEPGPMQATGEGSVGSRFSDIMQQVWNAVGGIPWVKVFAVADAVVKGLQAGKSTLEIVRDVIEAWNRGSL